MQPTFPIENRADLAPDTFARLAALLVGQRSIKHAIDWLVSHNPPLTLADMLTQDEYSHDFLVPYPGGLWLVYDAT